MAVAHCYVDGTSGNDSTGDGTVGNPWQTVQKALDTPSGWPSGGTNASSDGNQINLKNANTLSSSITWTTWVATITVNVDNPLIIRGYTTSANDGGVGEINGNGAVSNIFSTTSTPSSVILINLKLHNTTAYVIGIGSGWRLFLCEIYNGSGLLNLGSNAWVVACYLHTVNGTSWAASGSGTEQIWLYNFIKGGNSGGIRCTGGACIALGNIVVLKESGITNIGLSLESSNAVYLNNTVVGTIADAQYGLNINNDAYLIINNILANLGGASTGGGLYWGATPRVYLVGANHFYNCRTTGYVSGDLAGLDLTGYDQTTDPEFADTGNANYSVGTNCKEKGWPTSFYNSNTNLFLDTGAAQREEATGSESINTFGIKRLVGMINMRG